MNHLFFFKRLPSRIGSPFFFAIEKRYSVGFISRDSESTYCITYKISLSYKALRTSVVFDKSELKSIPSKKGWRISFFISWPVIGQPRRSRGSSYNRASIKLTTIGSISVGQSIFLERIWGNTYASLIPVKGTFPVTILKIMHPRAHKSEEQVDSQSFIISGARKFTVPTNVPLRPLSLPAYISFNKKSFALWLWFSCF